MTLWTDAHNHLLDPRLGDPEPVIRQMQETGVARCVVNTTCEADWPKLTTLSHRHPDFIIPAFGIHPWKADTATDGWQDRLSSLLDEHPNASLGECGLDRWISKPDIETQRPVFLDHLRIARELDRPLSIHCLKAWQPLLDAFAESPPPARFLMHSFNGSIETARRLIPLGAYFSFSGYFLSERKSALVDVFRQLPPDRILLETDAPDMRSPETHVTHTLGDGLNHPANLAAIGRAFAAAIGTRPDALADLTSENARRFFGS
jgi:TatD DNase family protein